MSETPAQISTVKNFFAGGFGGICLVAAGHPLDTIKVRLQTMPMPVVGQSPLYNGTFDCIRKTFSNEGLRGFYRGMATPLIGVTPLYSIAFFGYSLGKKLQTPDDCGQFSALQIFNAGMLSSVFTTSLTAPGERIKCLLQVQTLNKSVAPLYDGPVDCVRKLYQSGGLRSVYRGTFATMLRDVPAGGAYFVTYETLQDKLRPEGQSRSELSPLRTLFAGGMSGIVFWLVAVPPDVLKSRLQTAPEGFYPNGVRDVFREIMYKDGPSGLYRGATAVFLRAFPANAACFLGYEIGMAFISWIAPNL